MALISRLAVPHLLPRSELHLKLARANSLITSHHSLARGLPADLPRGRGALRSVLLPELLLLLLGAVAFLRHAGALAFDLNDAEGAGADLVGGIGVAEGGVGFGAFGGLRVGARSEATKLVGTNLCLCAGRGVGLTSPPPCEHWTSASSTDKTLGCQRAAP